MAQAQLCALLLRPVSSHDIQHLKKHFPVTDVVGHEQDQLAIEIIALAGTQALVQVDEPGIEIIRIFDSRFRAQFLVHADSPDDRCMVAWATASRTA